MQIGTQSNQDSSFVLMNALTERLPESLDLLSDMVIRPRFEEQQIADLLEAKWWQYGDRAVDLCGKGATPDQMLSALADGSIEPLPEHFSPWRGS